MTAEGALLLVSASAFALVSGANDGATLVAMGTRTRTVRPAVGIARPHIHPAAGRQPFVEAFVMEAPEGQLLEVVFALHLPRRLAGRLHRRQQQSNQDADDRNDHQKLD